MALYLTGFLLAFLCVGGLALLVQPSHSVPPPSVPPPDSEDPRIQRLRHQYVEGTIEIEEFEDGIEQVLANPNAIRSSLSHLDAALKELYVGDWERKAAARYEKVRPQAHAIVRQAKR